MTTATGTYELHVPQDMFNWLAPLEPDEAATNFADLFTQMFPSLEPDDLERLTDGALRWRELLLEHGVIYHGVVAVPAGYEFDGHVYGTAHWHVVAGPIQVPAHGDLNVGEVATQILGDRLDTKTSHVEGFDTDMGWGSGLITEVPLSVAGVELPTSVAVSAVISAPHGARWGLLVAGVALDVEQKHEMAAVVGLIAARSRILADPEPTESEPR